jgi:stage V sporulation protein G
LRTEFDYILYYAGRQVKQFSFSRRAAVSSSGEAESSPGRLQSFTGKTYNILKGGAKVKVTEVRIRRLTQDGKMRAIVSVTLNEKFVVHDVRIIEGSNGLFVAMPSKRTPNGEFRDIAHPINVEARQEIERAVLGAYASEVGEVLLEA